MSDIPLQDNWVTVTEAAEITGYDRSYVLKLAQIHFRRSEAAREIRTRRRSNGYDLWLPDLMEYIKKPARGPHGKHKSPNTPNT